jgi:hypothetical protein
MDIKQSRVSAELVALVGDPELALCISTGLLVVLPISPLINIVGGYVGIILPLYALHYRRATFTDFCEDDPPDADFHILFPQPTTVPLSLADNMCNPSDSNIPKLLYCLLREGVRFDTIHNSNAIIHLWGVVEHLPMYNPYEIKQVSITTTELGNLCMTVNYHNPQSDIDLIFEKVHHTHLPVIHAKWVAYFLAINNWLDNAVSHGLCDECETTVFRDMVASVVEFIEREIYWRC